MSERSYHGATSRSPKQHRCTRCTTTMCQQKIPLIYRHYPPLACCMSSALHRHRRKTIPVLPQTRAEVDLEDDWTRTTDDERFLLFSKGEENKILAFSTDQQLRALQAAETVYMDGTFSSCPALHSKSTFSMLGRTVPHTRLCLHCYQIVR